MSDERERRAILKRLDVVEDKVNSMRESVVKHGLQLDNGTKAFEAQRERLSGIEHKIEPRPPSIGKIVGITVTVVLAGATSLWGLANTLRDRPTLEQVRSVVVEHDKNGHVDLRNNVNELSKAQIKQQVVIESIQETQTTQTRKLDAVLDRLPKKRRR